MTLQEAEKQISQLREQLAYHGQKYYVEDAPEIEDYEYDQLYRQLEELEAQFPQLVSSDSPTQKVGGPALNTFAPVEHAVPMESLHDSFSEEELRDFDRRVDDYQYLYHATVKNTEMGPDGVYRYYSTQRPVDIGTYPKPPDNLPLSIVNYDDDRRRPVANGRLMAWGELTYAKPLTEKQMEDYELKPAPANPDRVRPSSTARLKDGARGQEPPKEPSQKRDHKNHEER